MLPVDHWQRKPGSRWCLVFKFKGTLAGSPGGIISLWGNKILRFTDLKCKISKDDGEKMHSNFYSLTLEHINPDFTKNIIYIGTGFERHPRGPAKLCHPSGIY